MSGFVFMNRFGSVPNSQSINWTIKQISVDYNADEEIAGKRKHREPLLLPDFSAHHLRYIFCTRLCENETNLKVIQSIMGHKDIQTIMDIYVEATEKRSRNHLNAWRQSWTYFKKALMKMRLTAKICK